VQRRPQAGPRVQPRKGRPCDDDVVGCRPATLEVIDRVGVRRVLGQVDQRPGGCRLDADAATVDQDERGRRWDRTVDIVERPLGPDRPGRVPPRRLVGPQAKLPAMSTTRPSKSSARSVSVRTSRLLLTFLWVYLVRFGCRRGTIGHPDTRRRRCARGPRLRPADRQALSILRCAPCASGCGGHRWDPLGSQGKPHNRPNVRVIRVCSGVGAVRLGMVGRHWERLGVAGSRVGACFPCGAGIRMQIRKTLPYPLSYEGDDAQATYQRFPAGTRARQPSPTGTAPTAEHTWTTRGVVATAMGSGHQPSPTLTNGAQRIGSHVDDAQDRVRRRERVRDCSGEWASSAGARRPSAGVGRRDRYQRR
jgi:hypothetical protein